MKWIKVEANLRIDLDEEWQIRAWAEALGCTPVGLRNAVYIVGPMSGTVREHLAKVDARRVDGKHEIAA